MIEKGDVGQRVYKGCYVRRVYINQQEIGGERGACDTSTKATSSRLNQKGYV